MRNTENEMDEEVSAGNQIPGFPSFIRVHPAMAGSATEPFLDCWYPDLTGKPDFDYANGVRHCQEAVKFGRECGSQVLLVNMISAMMAKGFGPIERGFVDELARKAVAGRCPPPMTESFVEATFTASGGRLTRLILRDGEERATSLLYQARGMPQIVAGILTGIIADRCSNGDHGWVWTVCGAALAGSLG